MFSWRYSFSPEGGRAQGTLSAGCFLREEEKSGLAHPSIDVLFFTWPRPFRLAGLMRAEMCGPGKAIYLKERRILPKYKERLPALTYERVPE